jgi:ABC-2 type transport system ATP-binding protein
VIEVKNLVRRYGDFCAVDDVSFNIENGEVVGLLGHNGAGKTTIMKMLTGYLEPSSGTANVGGIDVRKSPMAVQEDMGYLPENLPIYPELTVVQYLEYTARLRSLDPRASVRKAVQETGLAEKVMDPLSTLSRGYKQRVGVAQAILHNPKVLVLDEPTNGLDPGQIQQMRRLIRSLSTSATVILSTHILQEVNAVCDRAIILRSGKVVLDERLSSLRATQVIRIRTSEEAEIPALLDPLDFVGAVEQQAKGVWMITITVSPEEAAPALARAMVGAGYPVFEVIPESRDLETVFKEINEDESNLTEVK